MMMMMMMIMMMMMADSLSLKITGKSIISDDGIPSGNGLCTCMHHF